MEDVGQRFNYTGEERRLSMTLVVLSKEWLFTSIRQKIKSQFQWWKVQSVSMLPTSIEYLQ
jgi:hypothetical protein